jgi:hypothetical protein
VKPEPAKEQEAGEAAPIENAPQKVDEPTSSIEPSSETKPAAEKE